MTNLEKLRTGTPKQIADMLCKCLKNCSACPHFIRECCNGGGNGFEEWLNEEAKIPKDAPKNVPNDTQKGWIKLRTIKSYAYIKASKIVALWPAPAATTASGEFTSVYAIGRSSPWHVYGSIDEVMEKIKRCIDTED